MVTQSLEKELGKSIFREVKRVVKENTQTTTFSFDTNELTSIILNELNEFKDELLNLACEKIPEFYSIVFAEQFLKGSK